MIRGLQRVNGLHPGEQRRAEADTELTSATRLTGAAYNAVAANTKTEVVAQQSHWGRPSMKRLFSGVGAALCAVAALAVWSTPGRAQTPEVKEKPRMYTYVANWTIPRAKWADMEKARGSTQKLLEQGVASGTLVGYGDDTYLVHQAEGATHDAWWSAMSMAGLFNMLDQVLKSGSAASPVLESATKHWDGVYVSRFYNWRAGSVKGAYTHVASYKLKADAPDEALETLSKSFLVPMLEKLLADGTVMEYEIDEEAIHTEAPGTFWVVYITANAEGLDKVNAAVRDAFKANPLVGPSVGSMVDFPVHRDYLSRTNATYK